ncbi:uncharacterized protein LOC128719219 [Anopheles marshallii]|uniref:uncharacterized protein LOC128719219 n=1 Tax=Anopheles marshallii TaxID=1521116 RepID=UPI00237B1DBA|nr:uncharacterized protein LOC128719219 [Anopheles marshallii]
MIKSCTSLVALLLMLLPSASYAQLSFHNDPTQNSFSIKLPAFQQSFTRYFGNQPQGALLQQQPQQLQQQIPSTLTHPSLIGSQAQAYQQQQQPLYYQQPATQQQPQPESLNRYVAQFPDQPHYTVQENYINPNIRLRLQQQRLLQQQQQPQQQYTAPQTNKYQGFTGPTFAQPVPTAQDAGAYATTNQQQQPQYEYVQQPTGADAQQDQPQYQPAAGPFGVRGHQQQPGSEGDVSTGAKLIGVAYSPSNEVSQVKFSSGGLKYNF